VRALVRRCPPIGVALLGLRWPRIVHLGLALPERVLDGRLDAGHPLWVEPAHLPDDVDDIREANPHEERDADRRLSGDDDNCDGNQEQQSVGQVGGQVDAGRIHVDSAVAGD